MAWFAMGFAPGAGNAVAPVTDAVVPEAGIEPARLAAGDFESPASTNFTTPAKSKRANYRMCCGEFDYLKRARAF